MYSCIVKLSTLYMYSQGLGEGGGGLSIHHNPIMHAHHMNKVYSDLPVPLVLLQI